jgi:uncharacterized protein YggL (DUF469 family)
METTISTLKKVIAENSDYKALINAVITRIGLDAVNDVNNHGISGGFNGFIYYTETHAFAMKHRKDIVRMLEQQADELGQEVVEMVSGFGAFRHNKMDNEDRKELYKYLGGGRCEQSNITNLMAWYAAEEVCRMFDR